MPITLYNKAFKQTGKWIKEEPDIEKMFGFHNTQNALVKANGDRDGARMDLEDRYGASQPKKARGRRILAAPQPSTLSGA